MSFHKEKRAVGIGIMLVLTAFVSMTINVSGDGDPPIAQANGPYTTYECTSILLNATGSYDPEGALLTYRWNIEGDWYSTSEIKYDYLWRHVFSGTITLEVSDGDLTATDTAEVTVLNVPPVISSVDGPPPEITLGTEVMLSVTFFDGLTLIERQIPSEDTYHANFTWDDGSWTDYWLGVEDFFVSDSHMYSSGGVYNINISITDNNGGLAYMIWTVIVLSDSFFVEAGPDATIDEGSTFISAGFLTDAKPIAYSVIANYGDGSGAQLLSLNAGNTFDLQHLYYENGVYTVLITAYYEILEIGSDSAVVTVNNVPPTITSLTASPTDPVRLRVETNLLGVFTDPGVLDSHVALIDWGDGQTTMVNLPAGVYEVSGSHTYASAGAYTINLTVTDDDGGSDWKTLVYNIVDVDAGPDGFINEGSTFTSAGSFTCSASGLYTATVDYGDGSGPQPLSLSPGYVFDLSHQYVENGMYTVLVTIFKDGAAFISDSALVTVYNVAPVITSFTGSPTSPVILGVEINLAGVFTDPGVMDSHIAVIQWGDGQTMTVNLPVGVYQVSGSHTYASAGVYTITLTVTDDDGGSDSKTLGYDIVVVDAGPDGFINEGSMFTSAGSFSCSGGGLYTATVDYGDGSGPQPLSLSPGYLFDLSHQYVDNGIYIVQVTIFKDAVAFISDSVIVTVYNVAPIITSLSGPPTNPIRIGNAIYLLGVFTDPGVLDSHVVLIEWGDTQTTTVNLPAGVYQVNRSHTYASVGVYTITLTVTDKDGGFDTKSIETYVVVYDPICGFVTGGGWGLIPVGSYPANPDLGGRVNFGFVAKYKKGCYIPEGNTEFQFQVGDMNFHSHVYQWLIITGPKATYQGNGTINGQGHYGFRFTVIDGKISGGGGVDKFRMKIWDKDNDNQIIFDNDMGAPDDQDPSTPLSGGQITIHNK